MQIDFYLFGTILVIITFNSLFTTRISLPVLKKYLCIVGFFLHRTFIWPHYYLPLARHYKRPSKLFRCSATGTSVFFLIISETEFLGYAASGWPTLQGVLRFSAMETGVWETADFPASQKIQFLEKQTSTFGQ